MKDLLRLLKLAGRDWRWGVAGAGLSVVTILANVALLALSGWFIAVMGLAGLGNRAVDVFAPAAAIRGLAILRTVGRYGERLVTHEATFRLLGRLRSWLFARIEPLAPARLQAYRGGDLLSRLRADIDSLDNAYLRVFSPVAAAIACAVLMAVFLASFSLGLAILDVAGLLLAGLLVPLVLLRFSRRPGQLAVARRSELRADIADTVRGFDELLIDGALHRQVARMDVGYAQLRGAQRSEAVIGGAGSALTMLIVQLVGLGAVLLTIPMVRDAAITGPVLVMLFLFVAASFDAVAGLPLAMQTLGTTLAAARRVFDLADMTPVIGEPAQPAPAPLRHDIRFSNVRMRYDAAARDVLDDVSFTLAQGQTMAVVGPTGAGKSSLANVLLRFWPVQSGEITIGGVPVDRLGGNEVRRLCAVVTQNVHLFNSTIRANLLLARPDADDAALYTALRDAAILDEVLAMPAGLDTELGEAAIRLSAGQARRIAVARAFLKDAPILILDEPTEGLDHTTESLLIDALARLAETRTTLLITHRAQPLRLAQQIVTLRDGKIASAA